MLGNCVCHTSSTKKLNLTTKQFELPLVKLSQLLKFPRFNTRQFYLLGLHESTVCGAFGRLDGAEELKLKITLPLTPDHHIC